MTLGLEHVLDPLQAQRKRVWTLQWVFTKKRDGKNGRAVEAGGQHWCFGRQEQHWQLTQSKTPLKSVTRKALPERPVKADRKSGDWQKSQDWAGPYTHTISDDGWTQSSTLTTPKQCWRTTKPKNWGVSTVIGPRIFSTGRNSCQTLQALFVSGRWSDSFVTQYRERLFRDPADKTRRKTWGRRDASVAWLCPIFSIC